MTTLTSLSPKRKDKKRLEYKVQKINVPSMQATQYKDNVIVSKLSSFCIGY